jgi:CRISPR-associated protein Csm4
MPHYRITLTLRSPLGTPLISGTLWGHLAWAIRLRDGEPALRDWLAQQEKSPWLFSSAFPEGQLPRPMLAPAQPGAKTDASLEQLQRRKAARKRQTIPEAIFLALRGRMNAPALDAVLASLPETAGIDPFKPARVAHNRIDRLTFRTPEEGGLYFKDDLFPLGESAKVQLFAQTAETSASELQDLLSLVGEQGFGRDASTGCGVFACEVCEEKELFSGSGNRAMSLSHGVLTPDMRNPRYRLHTHYGRLGGSFAQQGENPFKYPILMAQPGATFDAGEDCRLFGELLGGEGRPVHGLYSHIRHHALHLPLRFEEVSP